MLDLFIKENVFESVSLKISSILFRPYFFKNLWKKKINQNYEIFFSDYFARNGIKIKNLIILVIKG